jgi:hypothetical protein
LKRATFNFEFSAGRAIVRIKSLNHSLAMTISTAFDRALPRTANVLPLVDPN